MKAGFRGPLTYARCRRRAVIICCALQKGARSCSTLQPEIGTPPPSIQSPRKSSKQSMRDADRMPDSVYKICEHLYKTDGGQNWRLNAMPFFASIYDKPRNKLLLMTSRQSTKTTYLRNVATTRSLLRRGNSTIYIAPTMTQVQDFSRKKLDNIFAYNPSLKGFFVDGSCTWNVGLKEFKVGGGRSTITLRSTGGAQGASRVRGNTANDILLDEFQDLLEEDLPVIEECAATFDGQDGRPHAFYVYTGTPLSNQNIIQKQFNHSRKYQWHMQCLTALWEPGSTAPRNKTSMLGKSASTAGTTRSAWGT
jgi:hypothetical protein